MHFEHKTLFSLACAALKLVLSEVEGNRCFHILPCESVTSRSADISALQETPAFCYRRNLFRIKYFLQT